MKFIAWLLSLFFAFSLGAGTNSQPGETDEDVQDVAQETVDELSQVVENTKNRVEEKFGTEDPGETDEALPAAEPIPEEPVQPEIPAPADPVNG